MTRWFPEYMVDIETLGKGPRAAIVQIGIVGFDLVSGEVGEPMTLATDPHQDADIEFDTVRWWMKQSDAARAAVFDQLVTYALPVALRKLTDFLPHDPSYEYRVWAMPPEFDLTILKSAYQMCNMKEHWAYNATRDLRTLSHLAKLNKEDRVLPTVQHDAGADCVAQALTAIKAWRLL